jgi:hypothetical protein
MEMTLTLTGTITNPYSDADGDQLVADDVVIQPPPPAPPGSPVISPTPTVEKKCTQFCSSTTSTTKQDSVYLSDAMATAKIAFLLGAASGLLLAYFLRSKGDGGDCCTE